MKKQGRKTNAKMIAPKVPVSVWADLYSAALEIRAMEPWKLLGDAELVCVRDPKTGWTGYGCYMGSMGTLLGFCLYRGADGYETYRKTVAGETDPQEDDAFAVQDCLMVTFGPKKELAPEDLAVTKALRLQLKRTGDWWPEFRSLLPGYAPWFLDESEAKFLTLGLDAALLHFDRVIKGEAAESVRDGRCMMYRPLNDEEFTSEWEPLPAVPAPTPAVPVLDLQRLNAIRSKSLKPDSPWEADVIHVPSPVLESGRPYYPQMALVVQQSSGFMFHSEVGGPKDSREQLLANAICLSVSRHGFLPEVIYVNDRFMVDALTPLAKELKTRVQYQESLSVVREARKEMQAFFMARQGGIS